MVTPKEQGRIQVLNEVLAGTLQIGNAAFLMGVSERHACLSADRAGGCWRGIDGKERPPWSTGIVAVRRPTRWRQD